MSDGPEQNGPLEGGESVFLLTFDLSGESFWRDRFAEAARLPKTLSIGRYGVIRGVPRLLDLLDARSARATWFVAPEVATSHPDAVAEVVAAGHEAQLLFSGGSQDPDAAPERAAAAVRAARDGLAEISGAPVVGCRLTATRLCDGWVHALTLAGIEWTSTLPGANLPTFWGHAATGSRLLDLPPTWALTDYIDLAFNMPPAVFPAGRTRIPAYARVLENWTDEITARAELGLLATTRFDTAVISKPGRISMLQSVLDLAAAMPGMRAPVATELVAQYSADQHSAAGQAASALEDARQRWLASTVHHPTNHKLS